MAWETRGGNHYYYRKRRYGRTVVSEYVGPGEIGALAEAEDQQQREKQAQDQHQKRNHANLLRQFEMIDRQVRDFEGLVKALYESALISAGYHQHRREWRRKNATTFDS